MIHYNKHLITLALLLGFMFLHLTNKAIDTTKMIAPKIELSGYGGALLIHRDAMEDLGNHPYFGTELHLAFQTTGNQYWHEAFNYPIYGLGFYSGYFNNPSIGNPYAVFTFLELPFLRRDKYYLSTCWGVGMTFNINEYDSITNKKNIAIGTDLNVYVNFSTTARYRINERWEIGSGVKFQHFSNGSVKQPNLGLNMISGQVIIAYYPGNTVNKFRKDAKLKPYKKNEFYTMFGMGQSTDAPDGSDIRFMNSTLSIGMNRRFSYKRNWGFGFDVFYNEYIKDDLEKPGTDITNSDLMSYGIFLSSELIVSKFRITTQLGTYLYRPTNYSIPIYERVAIRYYFIPNLFGNISIKAHGAKAQFIEWGIGLAF